MLNEAVMKCAAVSQRNAGRGKERELGVDGVDVGGGWGWGLDEEMALL